MKGVILAGGTGSRLFPLTKVHNKAALPMGSVPMIYHSIYKFTELGVRKIAIITGREHSGDFINLLGSGADFGCQFVYVVQDEPNGIPSAIALTKDFIGDEKFIVLLSDNIFLDPLPKDLLEEPDGCYIFLKEVPDPERYGVPRLEEGRIVEIIEKPEDPPSNFAVTGIYYFDSYFWEIAPHLKPSKRLETEIVDVFNAYLKIGKLKYRTLEGFWTDAGTLESYLQANILAGKTWPKPFFQK